MDTNGKTNNKLIAEKIVFDYIKSHFYENIELNDVYCIQYTNIPEIRMLISTTYNDCKYYIVYINQDKSATLEVYELLSRTQLCESKLKETIENIKI